MPVRRWIARGVALLVGLAGSGTALVRLVVEPLAVRHAEARIARQLGVPASVGSARLHLPATVELRDVRSSRGGADRVLVRLAPWALLVGDAHLRLATAEGVEATGRGTAERVELRPAAESPDGHEHLRIEGARHARRPLAARLILLDLDEDRSPRSLAVQGGWWDGVDAIEATAQRDLDTWSVKVAWQGLRASLRATSGEHLSLDADLHANEARLPARPLPWLELSGARLTGSLRLDGELEDLKARFGLSATAVTIDHRRLSSAPAPGLSGSANGEVRVQHRGRIIEIPRLEVRSGAAAMALSGRLDRDGHTDLAADMGATRCQALLQALLPLLPALAGMEVNGELTAHARVVADADRLAELALDTEIDIGCGVVRDAPAADPGRLALLRTTAALAGRPVRSLSSLGRAVRRAFLAAEDTKFFRHRGFDPWTIRRALAADLAAGRFERGASTITQQLARNLFLDQDRNLSRKLEEAIIAWRLEQTAGKSEMLEAWLHLIELGPGIRGVEDGAAYWFGLDPAQLDEDRAARLAALAPSPRRGFDPGWARRYRDLADRLATSRVEITPP